MNLTQKNHLILEAGWDTRYVVAMLDAQFASDAFSALGTTGPTNARALGGLIVHRGSGGLRFGVPVAKHPFITIPPVDRQDISGVSGGSVVSDANAFVNAVPKGKLMALSLTNALRVQTPAYNSGASWAVDSPVTSPSTGALAGLATLWTTGTKVGMVDAVPAMNVLNGANSLTFSTDLAMAMS